jgi:hypothetical protein
MEIKRFDKLNESKNNLYYIVSVNNKDDGYDADLYLFDEEIDAKKFIINVIYSEFTDDEIEQEYIYNLFTNYEEKDIQLILDGYYNFYNTEFIYINYDIIFKTIERKETDIKLNNDLDMLLKMGPDDYNKIKKYNI